MKVTMSDLILLGHATFGILGTLSALWVFVEALNAREENAARIRLAVAAVAISMCAAGVLGGYWYLNAYPADKAIIRCAATSKGNESRWLRRLECGRRPPPLLWRL